MKIPKYIRKKLERRTKLAQDLNEVSSEIDDWLESKGVNLGEYPICDCVLTGCRIYCEPQGAAITLINYLEVYNE